MKVRAPLPALLATCAALALATASVHARSPEQIRWATAKWQGDTALAHRFDGSEVPLTLRQDLQRSTKQLLRNARPVAGAAALVDVTTGAVLALAEIGNTAEGSLLFDPVAPAASVFKVVTTAALYERTSVSPQQKVCVNGGLRRIEREHLEPARGKGAVCAPLSQALGHSRNAVFAQLATQKLMRSDLLEVAEAIGFNRMLPFDAPARLGVLEVPYNDLAFARTAAGFENSRLSVLGAAQLMLTIARGGEVRSLRLGVESLPDASASHAGKDAAAGELQHRAFSAKTAAELTRMLEVTVRSGTSAEAFHDERGRSYLGNVRVAGKTGTLKPSAGSPTSSWFVGFAPSRKPRVVVSVLLQNPDEWHRKANQVARDLLRAYFSAEGTPGVTPPL
jgi:cell division protein FtsI/penicillin-binding protein 2